MSLLRGKVLAGKDGLPLLGTGLLVAMAALLLLGLAACAAQATPTPTPRPPTPTPIPAQPTPTPTPQIKSLTIYSGRGEELVGTIIKQFSQTTGIQTQVRYGSTAALATTLLEEGTRSPADLFWVTDPGGLAATSGMLAQLPDSLTAQVPAWARSPEGKWVGISGRARVVVYNTQRLTESDLPDDIWDFTDPRWKGRIGWAPTNSSFQAMVTAMRLLWGEDKTRQWLVGIKANQPKDYANNTSIVRAVGSGEVDVGFPNHYYLYRFIEEQGEAFPARNYHPRVGGPGAVILVAGAGILSTSQSQAAAQQFLEFMLSPVAQQYFASQNYEYPLVEGVKTHRLITPLSQVQHPEVDMASLGDTAGSLKLLRDTGVLP